MEKRSLSSVFISNVHQVDRIRIPAYMYTINIFCLKIIVFVWICRMKEIWIFKIFFWYRLHAGITYSHLLQNKIAVMIIF